jgi:hypothetical protein
MEKRNSILVNYKKIDYEGLKMEQCLLDFSYIHNLSNTEDFVKFEDIYFGLLSVN